MAVDLQNDATVPADAVAIIGINTSGATGAISNNATLPWLNDPGNVQAEWGAGYRDVVILDEHNEFVAAFNCTTYDLNTTANYDTLRSMIVDAIND